MFEQFENFLKTMWDEEVDEQEEGAN